MKVKQIFEFSKAITHLLLIATNRRNIVELSLSNSFYSKYYITKLVFFSFSLFSLFQKWIRCVSKKLASFFKEVMSEKIMSDLKKGGNFLISWVIPKFAQSRENVSILDRNFPAPKAFVDLTSYHLQSRARNTRKFVAPKSKKLPKISQASTWEVIHTQ